MSAELVARLRKAADDCQPDDEGWQMFAALLREAASELESKLPPICDICSAYEGHEVRHFRED